MRLGARWMERKDWRPRRSLRAAAAAGSPEPREGSSRRARQRRQGGVLLEPVGQGALLLRFRAVQRVVGARQRVVRRRIVGIEPRRLLQIGQRAFGVARARMASPRARRTMALAG